MVGAIVGAAALAQRVFASGKVGGMITRSLSGEAAEGITLMGTSPCPYVHRVEMTLAHYNIPYSYKEFDLGSLKDRTSLRQMSPIAKVPILIHMTHGREKSIFESASIVQYLDETFNPCPETRLMRGTPHEKAITRSWTHFVNHRIAPQMWSVLLSENDKALEKAHAELLDSLSGLEKALPLISTGPFFLGTKPSFFDIMLAPFLHRRVLISHFKAREMYPIEAHRVQELADAIEETQIFKKTAVDKTVLIKAYTPYLSGSLHPKFSWH